MRALASGASNSDGTAWYSEALHASRCLAPAHKWDEDWCCNVVYSTYNTCSLKCEHHLLLDRKSLAMQPDASTVGTATDAFACSSLWKSA